MLKQKCELLTHPIHICKVSSQKCPELTRGTFQSKERKKLENINLRLTKTGPVGFLSC